MSSLQPLVRLVIWLIPSCLPLEELRWTTLVQLSKSLLPLLPLKSMADVQYRPCSLYLLYHRFSRRSLRKST
jgi:hypothetical protein